MEDVVCSLFVIIRERESGAILPIYGKVGKEERAIKTSASNWAMNDRSGVTFSRLQLKHLQQSKKRIMLDYQYTSKKKR